MCKNKNTLHAESAFCIKGEKFRGTTFFPRKGAALTGIYALPVTGAAGPPYSVQEGELQSDFRMLPPFHQTGRSLEDPYSSFSPLAFVKINFQLRIAYRINAKMTSPSATYMI